MVLRKLQIRDYILVLTLLVFLQSCTKTNKNFSIKKTTRVEINQFLELGYKHLESFKYDSSYYYFNKANYAAEIKKETPLIICSLVWLAEIQRSQGNYTGSETTLIETLPFLESTTKYPYGETNIYLGLENNYLMTFDNDNAIYYYKKAINTKTDETIKSGIKKNIAIAYTEKGHYKKAIEILIPLLLNKKEINSPETLAMINDNLGMPMTKQKILKHCNI
jgi:tetratricopeptide (TPR) repeat protein